VTGFCTAGRFDRDLAAEDDDVENEEDDDDESDEGLAFDDPFIFGAEDVDVVALPLPPTFPALLDLLPSRDASCMCFLQNATSPSPLSATRLQSFIEHIAVDPTCSLQ